MHLRKLLLIYALSCGATICVGILAMQGMSDGAYLGMINTQSYSTKAVLSSPGNTDPVCGDGVVQPPEACEVGMLEGETCQGQGFAGGTVVCSSCQFNYTQCINNQYSSSSSPFTSTSSTPSASSSSSHTSSLGAICGNGQVEEGEECDGVNLNGQTCPSQGFPMGGALGCNGTCRFDTAQCTHSACGDGQLAQNEPCDAANLNGKTCQSLGQGFVSGTLYCRTDCGGLDTSQCIKGGTHNSSSAHYSPPDCGNGQAEPGEQCDTGSANGMVGSCCTSSCQFNSGSTVCLASAGTCDTAELCTGSAAFCPTNAFEPASTECRPIHAVCDTAEHCTGNSATCPANEFLEEGAVCRPSAGDCDVAEACNGTSESCLPDAFAPHSTVCREAAGECDASEYCPGNSASCSTDAKDPAGTVCEGDDDGLFSFHIPFLADLTGGNSVCNGVSNDCVTVEDPVCGNGTVDLGEDCDLSAENPLSGKLCPDVNVNPRFTGGGLQCKADCSFDTRYCSVQTTCGNAVIDANEECDPTAPNPLNSQTCRSWGFPGGPDPARGTDLTCPLFGYNRCKLDTGGCLQTRCHNGIAEPGEACGEPGLANCPARLFCGDFTCNCFSYNWSLNCGNGVVDPGEGCDDGNVIDDDACSDECTRNASCGNGAIDRGEDCDAFNLGGKACRDLKYGGDGFLNEGNNYAGGDLACSDHCKFDTALCLQAACGNGRIESGETCDPGGINGAAPDMGGQLCQNQIYIQAGNALNYLAGGTLTCKPDCTLDKDRCLKRCGDGVLDPGEECDPGGVNGGVENLGTNSAGQPNSCENKGFPGGGSLACNRPNADNWPYACTFNTNQCFLWKCGNGIIDADLGEECDRNVTTGVNVFPANPYSCSNLTNPDGSVRFRGGGPIGCYGYLPGDPASSCKFNVNSCVSCGRQNDYCCAANNQPRCNATGADSTPIACVHNGVPAGPGNIGICLPCGGQGGVCCSAPNAQCNATLGCEPSTGKCEACGGQGQPCCANNTCNAGATPALACDRNVRRCLPCGARGATCCTGGTCNNPAIDRCNPDPNVNRCEQCGIANRRCCHATPTAQGTCPGGTSLTCNGADMCVGCGSQVGQTCCGTPGSGTCPNGPSLACGANNQCVTCGSALGQPCCGNAGAGQGTCPGGNNGLTCNQTVNACWTSCIGSGYSNIRDSWAVANARLAVNLCIATAQSNCPFLLQTAACNGPEMSYSGKVWSTATAIFRCPYLCPTQGPPPPPPGQPACSTRWSWDCGGNDQGRAPDCTNGAVCRPIGLGCECRRL